MLTLSYARGLAEGSELAPSDFVKSTAAAAPPPRPAQYSDCYGPKPSPDCGPQLAAWCAANAHPDCWEYYPKSPIPSTAAPGTRTSSGIYTNCYGPRPHPDCSPSTEAWCAVNNHPDCLEMYPPDQKPVMIDDHYYPPPASPPPPSMLATIPSWVKLTAVGVLAIGATALVLRR